MELRPPESLRLTGNVDENWRAFKQQFDLYVTAMGLDAKPDTRKVALLLTLAGPQAIEVYNTFVFDMEDDKDKLDAVLAKFDAHCTPKRNETFERYIFRSRVQLQNESFDAFVTALRLKAQSCNFGTLRDSMVRDQIVFGIGDNKLRERLLRESDLTLDLAINICQATELFHKHMKSYSEMLSTTPPLSEGAEIGAVLHRGESHRQLSRPASQTRDAIFSCTRCGSRHKPRQCPAFGKTCFCCNGRNHFAKQCFA